MTDQSQIEGLMRRLVEVSGPEAEALFAGASAAELRDLVARIERELPASSGRTHIEAMWDLASEGTPRVVEQAAG